MNWVEITRKEEARDGVDGLRIDTVYNTSFEPKLREKNFEPHNCIGIVRNLRAGSERAAGKTETNGRSSGAECTWAAAERARRRGTA